MLSAVKTSIILFFVCVCGKTSIILDYNMKGWWKISLEMEMMGAFKKRNGNDKPSLPFQIVYSLFIGLREVEVEEDIGEIVFWGLVELFSLLAALYFICISPITFLYILCIYWTKGSGFLFFLILCLQILKRLLKYDKSRVSNTFCIHCVKSYLELSSEKDFWKLKCA